MTRIGRILTTILAGAICAMPAVAADVGDLSWLAGCWRSEEGGRTSEECWTTPGGGMLLGVHRDTGPRGAAFEFLRIGPDGDTLAYFASPSGRPATAFRLVESGERKVAFENLEHDFPQRLIYWLDGSDVLRARAESVAGDEKRGIDFAWQRVRSEWTP